MRKKSVQANKEFDEVDQWYEQYVLFASVIWLPKPDKELITYKNHAGFYYVIPKELVISFNVARAKINHLGHDKILLINEGIRAIIKSRLQDYIKEYREPQDTSIRALPSDFYILHYSIISEEKCFVSLRDSAMYKDVFKNLNDIYNVFTVVKFQCFLEEYARLVMNKGRNTPPCWVLEHFKDNGVKEQLRKPPNMILLKHLSEIAATATAAFNCGLLGDKFSKRSMNEQQKNAATTRSIVSETARMAVMQGMWEPRNEQFEKLKPYVDELAAKSLKHHNIAASIYKKTDSSGEFVARYFTSKGIAKRITQKELTKFIKGYLAETDRNHLIHGLK